MKMSHSILILPLVVLSLVACKSGSDRVLVKKPEGAQGREVEDPLKKTIGDGDGAVDDTESKYKLEYSVTQDGWSPKINELRYCIDEELCLGIGPLVIFEEEGVEGFQGDVIEISDEGSREVSPYRLSSKENRKVWTSEMIKLKNLLVQAAVTGSETCDSTYLVLHVAKKDELRGRSRVVLKLERGQAEKVNYIRAAVLKPNVKIDVDADLGEELCKIEKEAEVKKVLEELVPEENESEEVESEESGESDEESSEEAENENAVEAELHGENLFGPDSDNF